MSKKIVIELTNRCNLSCQHCFSGRHGGRDDLPLDVLDHIFAEARGCGFDYLSYTGGDPTVHPHFAEILQRTCTADYQFSLNTNGRNFVQVYPQIRPHRSHLRIITFSLDGATESTHDRLRGKGSFRRLMQAASLCMMEKLPFSLNMVVTQHSRHEIAQLIQLAARLGSHGVRFGHLMPSPLTTAQGFDLSPRERKQVEAEIWALRREASIPVAMAPGHYSTDPLPCAPLNLREINVDCRANVTKCCHLSGHGEGAGPDDIVGNLHDISLSEAWQRLVAENEEHRRQKLAHLASPAVQDADFFACWYCSNYYRKLGWLRNHKKHSWANAIWQHSATSAENTVAELPKEMLGASTSVST